MSFLAEARPVADEFIKFLNKAVSPFHAVDECSKMLKAAGFQELIEKDEWKIEPNGKYFVTLNKSAIYAFAVGGKFKPGNGVSMIAAHTDSPCPEVKPRSKVSAAGMLQVGVSAYGGGLWRTWFDRDLTVAGRVIAKEDDKLVHKLVHIDRPLMSIPNLCIHLETDREKFTMNKEEHLKPILATKIADELNCEVDTLEMKPDPSEVENDHHSSFLNVLARQTGNSVDQIVDFNLKLVDCQKAAIIGLHEEFIAGGRLDNLVNTYAAVSGLIKSVENDSKLADEPNIRLAACYDNEEVGSGSAQGACTGSTEWLLRRLCGGSFERAVASSFLVSADQGHALHPNYRSKHEENHGPKFHEGVVVKINANQRYATTAVTYALLKEVANRAQVPLQKYVVRNDSPCGSTVGPILAAKLGMKTIDVGTATLAMHSIREQCCTTGIWHAQCLYKAFYELYPEVEASLVM